MCWQAGVWGNAKRSHSTRLCVNSCSQGENCLLFEICRGKNSPFWNEWVQKSSSPLPKWLQEGRGRKGGAAAAPALLYLHFRAPDNKHAPGCLQNKALGGKQKLRFSEGAIKGIPGVPAALSGLVWWFLQRMILFFIAGAASSATLRCPWTQQFPSKRGKRKD